PSSMLGRAARERALDDATSLRPPPQVVNHESPPESETGGRRGLPFRRSAMRPLVLLCCDAAPLLLLCDAAPCCCAHVACCVLPVFPCEALPGRAGLRARKVKVWARNRAPRPAPPRGRAPSWECYNSNLVRQPCATPHPCGLPRNGPLEATA